MTEPEGPNKVRDREIHLGSLFTDGPVEVSIEPPEEAQHRRKLELEKAQYQQKLELEKAQYQQKLEHDEIRYHRRVQVARLTLGLSGLVIILVVAGVYMLEKGDPQDTKAMAKYALSSIVGGFVGYSLKKS